MSDRPISIKNEIRKNILSTARSYLGTPFKHQGRQPGIALDCVGVIACIGQSLGLFEYDRTNYARLPQADMLTGEAAKAGFRAIPVPRATPGDIYLMRFDRHPQHVALLSDIGIIHAYLQAGRVVEHRLDDIWRKRIVGAYTFPGIE